MNCEIQKVDIITFRCSYNYESALQAFVMQHSATHKQNILSSLGLLDRLYTEKIDTVAPIDYEMVQYKREQLVEMSRAYLYEALTEEKRK